MTPTREPGTQEALDPPLALPPLDILFPWFENSLTPPSWRVEPMLQNFPCCLPPPHQILIILFIFQCSQNKGNNHSEEAQAVFVPSLQLPCNWILLWELGVGGGSHQGPRAEPKPRAGVGGMLTYTVLCRVRRSRAPPAPKCHNVLPMAVAPGWVIGCPPPSWPSWVALAEGQPQASGSQSPGGSREGERLDFGASPMGLRFQILGFEQVA